MTLKRRAREVWPGLNDKEIDIVLWSCTTFPVGSDNEVLAALRDAYSKSDGNLLAALEAADRERSQAQVNSRLGG